MTDDVKSNDNQRADPADALADLAGRADGETTAPNEQGKVNPLSALDAMARSEVVVSDPDEFTAVDAETAGDEVFTGDAGPLGVSGGVHITSGDGYHRHHAHMYKKTMIPLLLLVGAMLVVIGFISATKVLGATPEQNFDPRMKLVMFASFPLAAVVLAGAWWFRRDVNKVTGTGSR